MRDIPMIRGTRMYLVAATAAIALVGSAQFVLAAKAAARGVVSKVDSAAKTFVVTNKKSGDVTASYDDKTVFKKAAEDPTAAPADATAADLKEKARVVVE